jgi:tetratricopeptide (TPR) repeat protein
VASLASPDAQQRENAFKYLREQGRYVEPIVCRIERESRDETTRSLCRQLLATDFVTELRAAVGAAGNGERAMDDLPGIRAQLAVLLRQVGLDSQAKAEGERALAELAHVPEPALTHSDARAYLRAYARAYEATGDKKDAEKMYARFIDFGGQVPSRGDCRACHHDSGPTQVAWFRDWWAGRRYAELVRDRGGLDSTIEELAATSTPDVATRMKLAYLREAQGQPEAANTLWATLVSDDRSGQVAQEDRR